MITRELSSSQTAPLPDSSKPASRGLIWIAAYDRINLLSYYSTIDLRWLHCVILKINEGCREVRDSFLFLSSSSSSDDGLTNTCYKLLWSDSVIKPQLVPMYLESVCDLPSNVLARFKAVHSPRSYGMKWIEAGTVTKLHKLLFQRNENLILSRCWPKASVGDKGIGGCARWGARQKETEKGRER